MYMYMHILALATDIYIYIYIYIYIEREREREREGDEKAVEIPSFTSFPLLPRESGMINNRKMLAYLCLSIGSTGQPTGCVSL